MDIQITYENRHSLRDIQRAFERYLSKQDIYKVTAQALNATATRVQGYIRKEVRASYTVNSKYLKRMSRISKRANASRSGLYTDIHLSYRTVPMIAFKHSGAKGRRRSGVSVSIKKGSTQHFKHGFIATMSGLSNSGDHFEHEGIFATGKYVRGKFSYNKNDKTASGRTRITELRSASPFTMSLNKDMEKKIGVYVAKDLPTRLKYLLQKRVYRMRN